jgi:hypothetical protein
MGRWLALCVGVVLLLTSLTSCANLSGLTGDELRTYTALQSENYEVTGSMYAYFFLEAGAAYVSNITEEELQEMGFDEDKTLKEQKYDKNRSWYDYINEYVTEEVTNLLLMCEAATEAGITLTNEDYNYVNNQLTDQRVNVVVRYQTDYETYLKDRYSGYVNEEDVTKIFLMETLAAKYAAHMEEMVAERMTEERVAAHLETLTFENGKDETVTRNLGHMLASSMYYDDDQAYENMKTAKDRFEAAGKTESAWNTLWKEFSDDANAVYENVRQGDMIEDIDAWLYAEGRAVGDIGIVRTDSGCHLLCYLSEGDLGYVADAKGELSEIINHEIQDELRAKFKIKIKKNVTEAIDV